MLIPAILKKDEILKEFRKKQYTQDLMFEAGCYHNYMPNIKDEPDSGTFQYAVVNNEEKLIGYIAYNIDWYSSQAMHFGIMSFDKGNPILIRDLYHIMINIIENWKIHRLEWYMIEGNPVERHYDKFCKKYNGRKIILQDTFKDQKGNYRNTIIYEIIQQDR